MKLPVKLVLIPTNANVYKTADGEFVAQHNSLRTLVGKQFDPKTNEWKHLPFEEVLCVNSLALNYYREKAKEGAILPADQDTASHLGV